MCAGTVMRSSAVEAISAKLMPQVMEADVDQTVLLDRCVLGELERSDLWGQIQIIVSANPQLDLPAGFGPADMIAKSELLKALNAGRKPQLAEELSLIQVQDSAATEAWVDQAFAANDKAVQDALSNPKKAKAAAGFLRGQVMKLSGGKADPKLTGKLIEHRLSEMGGVS